MKNTVLLRVTPLHVPTGPICLPPQVLVAFIPGPLQAHCFGGTQVFTHAWTDAYNDCGTGCGISCPAGVLPITDPLVTVGKLLNLPELQCLLQNHPDPLRDVVKIK